MKFRIPASSSFRLVFSSVLKSDLITNHTLCCVSIPNTIYRTVLHLQGYTPRRPGLHERLCATVVFYLFPVNRPPGPHELAASAILPPHSPRRLHITARDNSLTPEDRVYTLIPRYLSLRFGKTSDISQFSRRKSRYFDVKNNQYYPNRQVIHHIKSHRRHNKSAHSSDAARSIMRLFRTRLPRSCRTSTSPENRPEDHTARKTALREQQNVA